MGEPVSSDSASTDRQPCGMVVQELHPSLRGLNLIRTSTQEYISGPVTAVTY